MTDLAKLVVKLEAQSAQLTAELQRAKGQLTRFDKDVSAAAARIGQGIGLATSAAAVGFAAMLKGSIDAADGLSKMAQKVGIATDELSRLNYAAKLSDVDTAQLQGGLARLSKAAVEAAAGTGQAEDAFKALGVSVKNADGSLKSTSDLFLDLSDAIAGFEDGPQKAAASMAIFGRAGADLIPLLNAGRAGIEAAGDELARFGGVVTPEAGKQAEEFNDNLTRLKEAASGLANTVAADLLGPLVETTNELVEVALQSDVAATATDKLAAALDLAAAALILFTGAAAGPAVAALTTRLYATAAAALAARSAALQLGVAVNAYSARAIAATAASNALRGAMALLGGPAGVAVSAGLGIAFLISKMESAEERSERLSGRLRELSGDLGAMASAADVQELAETRKQIESLDTAIGLLQEKVIGNAGRSRGILGRAIDENAADKLKEYTDQRAQLILIEAQLQDRIDGVAAATTNANAAQEEGAKETLNYADALTKVGTAAEGAAKATSVYDDMLELSKKLEAEELERAAAAQEALNDAVRDAAQVYESTRTPLENYRAELEKLDMLRARFDAGLPGGITDDTYRRAVGQLNEELARTRQGLDGIKGKGEESFGSLSVFADQAARNMQDSLSEFLFDPFADGLDGMVEGFARALQKMAADLAAQEIFAGFGGDGALGGLLGGLGSAIGGLFGGGADPGAIDFANQDPFGPVQYAGLRDSGGPGMPGQAYAIGTGAQPELFVPDTAGTFYPRDEWMGGGATNITINVPITAPSGTVGRQTLDQISAAALSGAQRAVRRDR